MMLLSAVEMSKKTNSGLLDNAIEIQATRIKNRAKKGNRRALWVLDTTNYESVESAAKKIFVQNGYTFEDIGVIGGVRQIGKYICW